MSKKIKLLGWIILILFCIMLLIIAMLTIRDIISNEIAKDIFIKTMYTFGSIFILWLIILFITKLVSNWK